MRLLKIPYPKSETKSNRSQLVDHFSLFGGPVYRLLTGIVSPHGTRVEESALFAVRLTCVTLAVLAAAQGQFLSGATVPFIGDYAVMVRYLIALPALIAAGAVLEPKLRHAVKHRIASLVDAATIPDYEEAIARINGFRDSWMAFGALILLAFLPSFVTKGQEMIGHSLSTF